MKESGQKFRYSKAEVSKVKSVQFSTMGEDEIKYWTITEIKQQAEEDEQGGRETNQGNYTGEGELCDMRLGINAPFEKCKYCRQDRECPGHFGHIKLERAIYHIGYMDTVVKILKCICPNCSKLKLPPNSKDQAKQQQYEQIIKKANRTNSKKDHEAQGLLKKRLRDLAKILENVNECRQLDDEPQEKKEGDDDDNKSQNAEQLLRQDEGRCGETNLPRKITKIDYHKIMVDQTQEEQAISQQVEYPAEKVYQIFEKISPTDCKILGFSGKTKPKDLLIKNLLVPPPQVRPSISFSSNKPASHDDLTRVYKNVMQFNQKLISTNNESEQTKILHEMTLLVGRMMDNTKNRLKNLTIGKKKKRVKSIKERLKGKEGRFRQNLMGKRVDFSARSVISGDANLHVDQLGVPRAIAYELTVPQEVTRHNREFIVKLVENDQIKTILVPDKEKDKEEYIGMQLDKKEDINSTIDLGVIVERYLRDGDFVLFNRQPTLHKMSMMGHRIKILSGSTFRLNLCVTTPYNADFDGDEMNMHVPQSTETQSELKNLCHVPKQIVAPKSNKPVMGIVQDSLLGSCLFTLRDTFLTKSQVMILAMFIMDWDGQLPMPAILRPEPLWTGKQIISMIIPPSIQLEKLGDDPVDSWNSADDSTILIDKGVLLQGIMNKSIIGDGAGGLIHTVWLDENPQKCCDFMTQAQRIVNNWLTMAGFTISCSDMVPLKSCDDKVAEVMEESEVKWDKSMEKFQDRAAVEKGQLHKPGTSIFTSFEFEVNNILNDQRNKANKGATQNIPFRYNNFKRMVWSGSKGKDSNLAQVLGVVGQQNIDGKRPELGFNRRTLPHFQKDTHGLSERGYVKRNFFRGLLPYEFFFHTMGGREGLSDTAVKTARTGYIQRKLVKAIEDVKVCYDGTVRESSGTIIQTSYGEDCLAGEFIEQQKYLNGDVIKSSDQNFQKKYDCTILTEDQRNLIADIDRYEEEKHILQEEFEKLQEYRLLLRQCFVKPKQIANIYLPVSINRIIKAVKPDIAVDDKLELSPIEVYEEVQKLLQKIESVFEPRRLQENLGLFKAHVSFSLSSKVIVFDHKFTQDSLQSLISKIEDKFCKSIIHPGECVGSIAAQSIGEPTTQMTLNTFHHAGASDRNVTLGVPRLQELLDASRNIKTPQLTIYFHPSRNMVYTGPKGEDNSTPEEAASRLKYQDELKQKIQSQKIIDFISKTEIYYDPDPDNSLFLVEDNFDDQTQFEPWVLVIYFKEIYLFDKIKKYLRNKIPENFQFIDGQDEETKQQMFQIRVKKDGKMGAIEDNEDLSIHSEADDDEEGDRNLSPYQKLEKLEEQIIKEYQLKKGVPGITKVLLENAEYDFLHLQKNQNLPNKHIYKEDYLITDGTNLKEIFSLDEVDTTRTFSNDVMEIAGILGIEAARRQMIQEMNAVFDKYSIYVNQRHMNTLIDWMTHRGGVIPCTRNGINRIPNVSCLRKSSFEETVEMLYDAAVYSELDQMRGVSENIIFGQKCDIGTNIFDLYINYDQVSDPKIVEENIPADEIQEEMYQEDDNYGALAQTPMYPQTPGTYFNTPMRTDIRTPLQNQSFTPSHNFGGQDNVFSPQYYQQSIRSQGGASPAYKSPVYRPPISQHSPSGSSSPQMSGQSSPEYSPQHSQHSQYNQGSSPTYLSSQNSPNSIHSQNPSLYGPNSPNYNSSIGSNSPALNSASGSGGEQGSPQSQSPSYQMQQSYGQSPVYKFGSSSNYQSNSPQNNQSSSLRSSGNQGLAQGSDELYNSPQEQPSEGEEDEDEEDEDYN